MLQIVNFKFGQLVHHNLPLLDGRLPSLCDHSENTRQCSVQCGSDVICFCNDRQYTAEALCGKFWLLVHLIEGDNALHLVWNRNASVKLDFKLRFQPRDTNFTVRFLYLTCATSPEDDSTFDGGHFQSPTGLKNDESEAKKKIQLAALMMQTFFKRTVCKEKISVNLNNKSAIQTFHLQLDLHSWPVIQTIKLPACVQRLHQMSESELWTHVAEHILRHPKLFHTKENSYDCQKNGFSNPSCNKYVAFCSFTRYVYEKQSNESEEAVFIQNLKYDQLMKMAHGFVCIGGGDLALVGNCSLFTWPSQVDEIIACFRNDCQIDRTRFLDDSGNNP